MKKIITSQNPEEHEVIGKYSDDFVNFWVPVIRKFRETTQFAGFLITPSMNECLDIMSDALKDFSNNEFMFSDPSKLIKPDTLLVFHEYYFYDPEKENKPVLGMIRKKVIKETDPVRFKRYDTNENILINSKHLWWKKDEQ